MTEARRALTTLHSLRKSLKSGRPAAIPMETAKDLEKGPVNVERQIEKPHHEATTSTQSKVRTIDSPGKMMPKSRQTLPVLATCEVR